MLYPRGYAGAMVLLAVVGGTGLAGRAVVAHAVAAGHQVRSLSRHLPEADQQVPGAEYVQADLRTGAGVADGLAGVEALIETMDSRAGAALRALPIASVSVLAAAARAGVRRSVLLTIVNAGESSMGYYQAQAARARSYESANYEKSGMIASVVYATQFHNLLAGIFATGAKMGVIPAFRGVRVQPISTTDVATALVAQALRGDAAGDSIQVGGPSVQSMDELAQLWKKATGSRATVAHLPLPGSFGAFLRTGRNLIPDHAIGKESFETWLAQRA